jgi:hypothetical protein
LKIKNQLLLGLLPLLLLAACSPSQDAPDPEIQIATGIPAPSPTPTRLGAPDLSGEALQLPVICLESGLEEAQSSLEFQAFEDFVNYVNSGAGVFGAELELHMVALSESVDEDGDREIESLSDLPGSIIIFCDHRTEKLVSPQLKELNILGIGRGVATWDLFTNEGPLFSQNPLPESHLYYWINQMDQHWPSLRPLGATEATRLAIFTDQADLVSNLDLVDNKFKQIEIVYTPFLSNTPDQDIFEFAYAVRDANANALFIHSDPIQAAALVNALNSLGLRERIPIYLTATSAAGNFQDQVFLDTYLENIFVSTSFPAWGSDEDILAGALAAQNPMVTSNNYIPYFLALNIIDFAVSALEEALILESYPSIDVTLLTNNIREPNFAQSLMLNENVEMLDSMQTANQLQVLRFTEAGIGLDQYFESRNIFELEFASDIEDE